MREQLSCVAICGVGPVWGTFARRPSLATRATGAPREDARRASRVSTRHLILPSSLKIFGPVLDQQVERFLGRALVGDDIVVDALLHGEHELGVGRLLPEVLDPAHGLQEVGRERRGLGEVRDR